MKNDKLINKREELIDLLEQSENSKAMIRQMSRNINIIAKDRNNSKDVPEEVRDIVKELSELVIVFKNNAVHMLKKIIHLLHLVPPLCLYLLYED